MIQDIFHRPRIRPLASGIAAGLLSGALFVQVAHAAPSGDSKVRYSRKSGKVRTKNTLDTKFKAAKKKSDRDKKRKVEMMTAEEFAKKRAAVAREVADKQIGMLKRLIKATEVTDPEYPDLLFRLADHFLEKKAYFDLQAGSLYEKIYDAEEKGNKQLAQQLKQKQKRFQSEAKKASAEAVKVYKALVSTPAFAKYKRMDEAIYYYAFELGQLGRESEMKQAYLRLIREYPNSKFIANAYLSFADYYFARNKIAEALKLYQKIVTGYPDSPVYAYALYKIAWCYLNPIGTAEPQYDKSLSYFVKTINATLQGKAGNEANARQLRRDARRDLVRAYVHAGRPSKAWSFFQKVGNGPSKKEDMARKMMEMLAVAYFGEGMYVESTAIYKKLQEIYPNDPLACEWQGRIVVNALATDDKAIQWKETERLAQYWEEYRDSNHKKSVKRKCYNEALDTVKQMATVWHDEAEKTHRLDTYDYAEKAYQAFLRYFPKDKDAYEMQYYYAELLWAQAVNHYNSKDRKEQTLGLEYFKKAHDEFVKVLEMNPKGKYTKDAAYAQMLAMKNALEYDETGGRAKACKTNSEGLCVYKEKKKRKKTKVSKDGSKAGLIDVEAEYPKSEPTEAEAKMLAAYDLYQKYVNDPKDKELPLIMYHRAKIMMEHNRFEEARPLLEKIVTKFDGSVQAAWSAEMLVDVLTINWLDSRNTPEQTIKASEDLEQWANKLMKMKVWKHPEADRIREAIPRLLAGIGWKRAMAYQDKGRETGELTWFVKCAQEFVQLYNDYPEHDRADTLLWNASLCFEAAYLVGQSIKFRNALLKRYPNSVHAKEALHMVAGNYQAIAYYQKAAEKYEEYAEKYRKDKHTPEALQNAYLFRLGLGQEEKAQEDLTKYEGLYKKKNPQKAAKIFWSKYDLLETTKEKREYAELYLKTYGRRGGRDREAVAHAEIGQIYWRNSCPEPLLYDSCISVKRKRAVAGESQRQKAAELRRKTKGGKKKKKKYVPPKYCGQPTRGVITVHKRDKKKAQKALDHLKKAVKLASGKITIPDDDIQRIEAFRNAWGKSLVYLADAKYEEYLTIEMPKDLDFLVEDWKKDIGVPKYEKEYKEQVKRAEESKKRVAEYFQKKIKMAEDLEKRYAEVKKTKSPYWVLAAAARSAVVYQNFADQLYRAEVPKGIIKTEDQYYAYCDALADQAKVPEEKALAAFTYCLERSTEFQFFNEFSRMCEEELQQRDPDKYPATNELFGLPVYTDSQMDVVGVQLDLDASGVSGRKRVGRKKKDGEDAASAGKQGL